MSKPVTITIAPELLHRVLKLAEVGAAAERITFAQLSDPKHVGAGRAIERVEELLHEAWLSQ